MYLRLDKLKKPMQLRPVLFAFLAATILSCKDVKEEKNKEPEPIELEAEKVSTSLYEDLDGNPVALADYKGKKILLNYWATWCRPCIEEMPGLVKLQDILEQENYVFLFASDQSIAKISDFKNARDFDFKYLKYNGAYADQKISAIPVTFIYNEVGEQLLRINGSTTWDNPLMIEKLRQLH